MSIRRTHASILLQVAASLLRDDQKPWDYSFGDPNLVELHDPSEDASLVDDAWSAFHDLKHATEHQDRAHSMSLKDLATALEFIARVVGK